MLDQKHINIIVRAIMPELYRIQGVHDNYWNYLKQRQESPPKTDYRDPAGVLWIGTGNRETKAKRLN